MKLPRLHLTPLAAALQRCFAGRCGWGALAALPGLAFAGPAGEDIVAGNVAVNRPEPSGTVIDQGSQNAIVNWQRFSVGANEYVIINQPGASATLLNRVVGADPSAILGQLSANGRVFLVNPNGIYFAPGAQVDVGGLVATALDIADQDFLDGNYMFGDAAGAAPGASVVNDGNINVSSGGFVVLAGDYVNNSGVIQGQLGEVVLAAGSQVTLSLDDSGLVDFSVDAQTVAELAGVENVGQIINDGGRILMTAKVANALLAQAVNNEGLLRARSIVEERGEVYLRAAGGNINHTGSIDVAGDGSAGGGYAMLRGDADIVVGDGGVISANGGGDGNGGGVRLIADGRLEFRDDALISARGGDAGGTGGTVELSGHGGLALRGAIDAPGGQVVIDPAKLHIVNNSSAPTISYGTTGSGSGYGSSSVGVVGKGFIENQLRMNMDVTLVASSSIFSSGGGGFDIDAGSAGQADLTLAIGSVFSSDTGSFSNGFNCASVGVCVAGPGNLVFSSSAGGRINMPNVNINVHGDFDARAGLSINLGNVTAGSDIDINASTGSVNVGNLGAGATCECSPGIFVNAGGDVTVGNVSLLGGSGEAPGISISGTGTMTVGNVNTLNVSSVFTSIDNAAGDLTVGDVDIRDGTISISNLGGTITVGNVDASQASVQVNNNADGDITLGNLDLESGGLSIGINNGNFTLGNLTWESGDGDASGSFFFDLPNGDLTAGNINVAGPVSLRTNVFGTGSANNDLTVGTVTTATGDVLLDAAGSAATLTFTGITGGGDVDLSAGGGSGIVTGGNVTAASSISINAGTNFGSVDVGILSAGSDVSIDAGLAGWGIVKTGNITAGSSIFIDAGDSIGSVTVGNLSAQNELYISAGTNGSGIVKTGNASGGSSIVINAGSSFGSVDAGNLVSEGDIDIRAGNNGTGVIAIAGVTAGSGFGDDISIAGGSTSGEVTTGPLSAGGDVRITGATAGSGTVKTGNITAGDRVDIVGAGSYGSGSVDVGNVVAGGSVDIVGASGSSASGFVTAGNITAGEGVLVGGGQSFGSVTVGNVVGGQSGFGSGVQLVASGSYGGNSGANVTAGSITAPQVQVLGYEVSTGQINADTADIFANAAISTRVNATSSVNFGLGSNGPANPVLNVDVNTPQVNIDLGGASGLPTVIVDNGFGGAASVNISAGPLGRLEVSNVGTLNLPGGLQAQVFDAESQNGVLNIAGAVTVGSGLIVDGDGTASLVTQFLNSAFAADGLPPFSGFNAIFSGRQGVNVNGAVTFDGNARPGVAFLSNGQTNINSTSFVNLPMGALPDPVVVYAPYDPLLPASQALTYSIAPTLPAQFQGGTVYLSGANHFNIWPGTTIVTGYGVPGAGPLFFNNYDIANINIGAQNLFVVTSGNVNSIDNVTSTGIVRVIGVAEEPFPVPVVAEFSNRKIEEKKKKQDDVVAESDSGGGDDDDEVKSEDGDNKDSMQCS